MKNIFLTGEVGVGKSTVIQKILSLLPSPDCGGFRTVSAAPLTKGAMLDVFIENAWQQTPHDDEHLVGSRWSDGHFSSFPSVFDTIGTSILASCPINAKLIIMDELGLMESDAKLFQKAVMDALDGPLPVLGVIKPKSSAFLDTIRAHKKSEIVEVTKDNRDALPFIVAELLLRV
jgi:nucleoside-triphosphatase